MTRGRPPIDEMGFWDHVEELRQRILRGLAYVAVGACIAWFFRSDLLALLQYPALEGARRVGLEDFAFRIFEAASGFMLMIQIAVVGGIVLASPLITLELWGFLAPALHPHEKRWVLWAVPSATLLFLSGVAICYWIAPAAFAFFLRFNLSLGVSPELTLGPYLYFFLRLILVFGVLFELPLFLMVLAGVGIVTSAGLLRQWRLAIVAVFLVAAIATPTGDALTMTMLAGPMICLYALSIFLVRLVEQKQPREASSQDKPSPPPEGTGPQDPAGPGPEVPDGRLEAVAALAGASDDAVPLPYDLGALAEETAQPYDMSDFRYPPETSEGVEEAPVAEPSVATEEDGDETQEDANAEEPPSGEGDEHRRELKENVPPSLDA
ncbi:MAG: twin-arginine translocase subunit TatC [Armatimonadota bacterium]